MALTRNNPKGDLTRKFIIERAAKLFNKKGYAGTSLNDILAVTNLTKGALYGHFENKDQIALEVFEYNYNSLKERLISAVSTKSNSIDQLLMVARFYKNEYINLCDNGGCPILNAATDADDSMPLLFKKVQKSLKQWKKLFEGIMITGQEKKEVKKNIEPAKYAVLIIALIEGGLLLSKTLDRASDFMITIDQVEKLIHEEIKN